jgi:hypothetical protein
MSKLVTISPQRGRGPPRDSEAFAGTALAQGAPVFAD